MQRPTLRNLAGRVWRRHAARERKHDTLHRSPTSLPGGRLESSIGMWPRVLLDILGTWFPTIRMWPRETPAMVIGEVHKFLGALAIQDNEWHYHEILNHVRQIPRERNVVVTGHS